MLISGCSDQFLPHCISCITSYLAVRKEGHACSATGCSLPTSTLPIFMVLVGRLLVLYTCSQYLQHKGFRWPYIFVKDMKYGLWDKITMEQICTHLFLYVLVGGVAFVKSQMTRQSTLLAVQKELTYFVGSCSFFSSGIIKGPSCTAAPCKKV